MVRQYPCCMCPALHLNFKDSVCPECDFVLKFMDERGWMYCVRSGLGDEQYKAFYIKPGKTGAHCCKMLEWRNTFGEAQEDLNKYAQNKGWKVL